MKTDSPPMPNPMSEAKLQANRENAKPSTGPSPAGCLITRFNACRHELSAKVPELILNTPAKRAFFRRAWAQLGPRNAIEAGCVRGFLFVRVQEESFLDVEAVVPTRRPVTLGGNDERLYPFLEDEQALKTLDQMARHLAHHTHVADKELAGLLQARKDNWGEDAEGALRVYPVQALNATAPHTEGAVRPEAQPDAEALGCRPGTLAYLLADTRLILPGEDAEDYTARAKALWATFRPVNILEGFMVSDFIQTQLRHERVLGIQEVLLARSAISDTGAVRDIGFAFIQDAQRNRALESLRAYEAGLRRRRDKRLSLLRKLRKEKWTEKPLPSKPPASEPRLPSHPASDSSRRHPATNLAASPPAPTSGPLSPSASSPSRPCESLPRHAPGKGSSANNLGAAGPAQDNSSGSANQSPAERCSDRQTPH